MLPRWVWLLLGYVAVFGFLALVAIGVIRAKPDSALGGYRFRITIMVDVNGETRSGSSVIEVSNRPQIVRWLSWSTVISSMRGDAVFVDLGQGRNLIALLQLPTADSYGEHFGALPPRIFDFLPGGRPPPRMPFAVPRELSGSDIPLLVSFSDLNDPLSIREVPPDSLQSVFGQNVRLKRVTIEMTNDPVTRHITDEIPWLQDFWKKSETLASRKEIANKRFRSGAE